MSRYDIAVLGGGPGGEAAAARAILRGAKTCLIEQNQLGGCCLNVGCIPTKAMLHASELYHNIGLAKQFGIDCLPADLDGEAFMKRVRAVVATLAKGLDRKIETSDIDLIRGRGRLADANHIEIELTDGGRQQIEADSIILATGSSPARQESFPWDSPRVMTTDQAARADTLPESILIVGGGVIGCEFATIYAELGIPTTLVEMLDRLAWTLDEDASKLVHRSLRRRKADVRLGARIVNLTADDEGVTAEMEDGETVRADCVLVAVGRRPNVEDLGLEAAGVKTTDGLIVVDEHCRTNVANIYAIGDVAEKRQYAHLAARMGVVAADNAAGFDASDDRTVVPAGLFTHPEVASVGLTEAQAKQANPSARASAVQYQATGIGWAYAQRDGLVKLIADTQTGKLLGALVVGYHAADVVQELALAMRHELTIAQLAETIHAHPTFVEAVAMAAEKWLADGRP